MKWGVGVDNVDSTRRANWGLRSSTRPACSEKEVADLPWAMSPPWPVSLSRSITGCAPARWPKPSGISLEGRTVALVGYGDIGSNLARRLLAADMRVVAYDPVLSESHPPPGIAVANGRTRVDEADFIVLTLRLDPGQSPDAERRNPVGDAPRRAAS